MNYTLVDLLPYNEDTILSSLQEKTRVLQVLLFLSQSMHQAILSFHAKQFKDFDAQVSENLCQIRADHLLHMLQDDSGEFSTIKAFDKEVHQYTYRCRSKHKEYESLSKKRPSHYSRKINQPIALQEFLQEHQLDISYSDQIYFLAQTYILSRYKLVGEHNISHGINYDKLCCEINISSKTFARKIIHRLQRNISMASCQFIYKLMYNLDMDSRHAHLLNSLYRKDEVGRHVFSCYEATKIILKHKLKTKNNIKIIVNRIGEKIQDSLVFYLKPALLQNHYAFTLNVNNLNDGITTFVGISRYHNDISESKQEYINRFMQVGFEDVILSNMAQHPQYAGILLDDMKHNPYIRLDTDDLQQSYIDYISEAEKQFLKHKYLAECVGCHPDNSVLFLLTHVYCDNISNENKNIESQYEMKKAL